jgi:membrane protein YqaA with SNARE-associated domain
VGPDALARVERWFARYGVWSLLFAGLPILGDSLMVMAGAMRVHLLLFLMLVTAGKLVRYGALAAATLGWM